MYNFRWQIPRKLAGMARPALGGTDDAGDDIAWLHAEGVSAIVSLTDSPMPKYVCRKYGMEVLHEPVPDGSPPAFEQIDRIVRFIDAMNAACKGVAVHCEAGHGRTGTALACYLVKSGLATDEAISRVRRLDPLAIETPSQETLVASYETSLRPDTRK